MGKVYPKGTPLFEPVTAQDYPRLTVKEGVKTWYQRPLLSKVEGPKLTSPVLHADEYTVEKKGE